MRRLTHGALSWLAFHAGGFGSGCDLITMWHTERPLSWGKALGRCTRLYPMPAVADTLCACWEPSLKGGLQSTCAYVGASVQCQMMLSVGVRPFWVALVCNPASGA
jgi:hypothetical protein